MSVAMLDTLSIARELEATGMPAGQAQGIAAAIAKALRDEELATKPFVKGEIDSLRVELHREINGLAWKVAGLLLAHAAGVVATLRLSK
jgi:hypothetical protein